MQVDIYPNTTQKDTKKKDLRFYFVIMIKDSWRYGTVFVIRVWFSTEFVFLFSLLLNLVAQERKEEKGFSGWHSFLQMHTLCSLLFCPLCLLLSWTRQSNTYGIFLLSTCILCAMHSSSVWKVFERELINFFFFRRTWSINQQQMVSQLLLSNACALRVHQINKLWMDSKGRGTHLSILLRISNYCFLEINSNHTKPKHWLTLNGIDFCEQQQQPTKTSIHFWVCSVQYYQSLSKFMAWCISCLLQRKPRFIVQLSSNGSNAKRSNHKNGSHSKKLIKKEKQAPFNKTNEYCSCPINSVEMKSSAATSIFGFVKKTQIPSSSSTQLIRQFV